MREGTPDTAQAHSARMYDYFLGGKEWCEADRETAEALLGRFPGVRTTARANRGFMHRATRHLARDHGVRQFLDLGTGIPTEPNLHQVAQGIAPESRVLYVDNDPLVLEHADVLLQGTPEGRTTYLQADARTDDVLAHPKAAEVLDLSEPVAVSLVALLHFFTDEDEPYALVRRLLQPLAPGSFLVLSHGSADFDDTGVTQEFTDSYSAHRIDLRARTRPEVERFFDGLHLLSPGLVVAHRWRPDGPTHLDDSEVRLYAGVARKP